MASKKNSGKTLVKTLKTLVATLENHEERISALESKVSKMEAKPAAKKPAAKKEEKKSEPNVDDANYAELRKMAQALGIPAKGKTEELRKAVKKAAKKAEPKAEAKPKAAAESKTMSKAETKANHIPHLTYQEYVKCGKDELTRMAKALKLTPETNIMKLAKQVWMKAGKSSK